MKKVKPPIMIQQVGWECSYIYELGWHGRSESLTTSPSRDCTPNLVWERHPCGLPGKRLLSCAVKAERLTSNFAINLDFLPIVSKVLWTNLLYYRLNTELCMIKQKERKQYRSICWFFTLQLLAKLSGALLHLACKWHLKQLKQIWQYANVGHHCTYY